MRLYLSGISKLHIGYTPDTLIIENKGKRYEYDVRGSTDFSPRSLDSRTKGELAIRNNYRDEYRLLTATGYSRLLKLLKDPNSHITVAVYPVDDKQYDDADKDEIIETLGCLQVGDKESQFTFHTEFYGI